MNIFSNKFINIVSLIITIIIFFIMNFFITKNKPTDNKAEEVSSTEVNIKEDNEYLEGKEHKEIPEEKVKYNWYIKIESINLYAPIEESVDLTVLNNYVGHFEDTSLTVGNVGLAGHNRGFKNNYFENLKNIRKGDEIIYKYNDFIKTYMVDTIEIIRNTDWSYLENTKENKITMITCTENEPNFRLCIQATENI